MRLFVFLVLLLLALPAQAQWTSTSIGGSGRDTTVAGTPAIIGSGEGGLGVYGATSNLGIVGARRALPRGASVRYRVPALPVVEDTTLQARHWAGVVLAALDDLSAGTRFAALKMSAGGLLYMIERQTPGARPTTRRIYDAAMPNLQIEIRYDSTLADLVFRYRNAGQAWVAVDTVDVAAWTTQADSVYALRGIAAYQVAGEILARYDQEAFEAPQLGDVDPPAPATGFVAHPFGTNADLTWAPSASADLQQQILYRSTQYFLDPLGSDSLVAYPIQTFGAASNSYQDQGLSPDSLYFYRLVSLDESANHAVSSIDTVQAITVALAQPANPNVTTNTPFDIQAATTIAEADFASRSYTISGAGGTPAPTLLEHWSQPSGTLSSFTSDAFTPAANEQLYAVVAVKDANGAYVDSVVSTSGTLTAGGWTEVLEVRSPSGSPRTTLALYTATAAASPASGAVTFYMDVAVTSAHIAILQVPGVTTAVVQSKAGADAEFTENRTPTLTLDSTPGADALVIGAVGTMFDTNGITPGSGFTELLDQNDGGVTGAPVRFQVQYDNSSPTGTVSWSDVDNGANEPTAYLAWEVETSGGSTATLATTNVWSERHDAYQHTIVSDGAYTITARLTDSRGNVYSAPLGVTAASGGGGDVTAPTQPNDLVATAGDGLVTITGTYPSDSDLASCSFQRSTNGADYSTFNTQASPAPGNSYSIVDGGRANGTLYYYRMRCQDEVPNVSTSNVDTATPAADPTPVITAFNLTNPSGNDVEVSFNSDQVLTTITATVSGGASATLNTGDFSQSGSYTYTATYTAPGDGSYTVTLDEASNANGDGAAGQSSSIYIGASSSILPQDVAWQQVMYNSFLQGVTIQDVTIPAQEFTWDGTYADVDELADLYVLIDGATVSSATRAEPEWYVLDAGDGRGIEATGQVRHWGVRVRGGDYRGNPPAMWQNEVGTIVNLVLPLSGGGNGNPHYQSSPLCTRAMVLTAVDMMMYRDVPGEIDYWFDMFGKGFHSWAESYRACKWVLTPTVQAAFEDAFEMYLDRGITIGPRGVNTNMDTFFLHGAAEFYMATADGGLKQKAIELVKRALFGYTNGVIDTNHLVFKLDGIDGGVFHPAGFIMEGDQPDIFYGGESFWHLAGALAAVQDRSDGSIPADWQFLQTVLQRMMDWHGYQQFYDPWYNNPQDGPEVGPLPIAGAGFSGRTGAGVPAGQADDVWKFYYLADVISPWKVRDERRNQSRLKSATGWQSMTDAINSHISNELNKIDNPYTGTPNVWDGNSPWSAPTPYLPPEGWYSRLKALVDAGDPSTYFPASRSGFEFNRAFGGGSQPNAFWAYKDHDQNGEAFGWFIETMKNQGDGYGGFYGGKIETFWTHDMGVVVINRAGKSGCAPDEPYEDRGCWDNMDYRAVHHVWGRGISNRHFSTHQLKGTSYNRPVTYNLSGTPKFAEITNTFNDPTLGNHNGEREGNAIDDQVVVKNRFEAITNGIEVTHTITSDGSDTITELYATIPIHSKQDLQSRPGERPQGDLSDTGFEYWNGSSWVAMPTTDGGDADSHPDYVNTEKVRLVRNFLDGSGAKYAYIGFPASYRVRLGDQVYEDPYQTATRARNLHIDILGNAGTSQSFPTSKIVSYTITSVEPAGGGGGGGGGGGSVYALQRHPTNPRYAYTGDSTIVFISGTPNVAPALSAAQVTTDKASVDAQRAKGMNHMRIWTILPWAAGDGAVFPWARTGPGTDNTGQAKFDLTVWNQTFFDRIEEVVAHDTTMFFQFMLFDEVGLEQATERWNQHPFHPSNNINGLGLPTTDCVPECYNTGDADLLALQEAYVQKVLDELDHLPNIYYEIANETNANWTWQKHWVDFLDARTDALISNNPFSQLASNRTYAKLDVLNYHNLTEANTNSTIVGDYSLGKIIKFDEQVYSSPTDSKIRQVAWQAFVGGGHINWDETGGKSVTASATSEYMIDFIQQFGIDAADFTPDNSLVSAGFCMANEGTAYIVFLPSGASVDVDLSAASGAMTATWMRTDTGAFSAGQATTGGAVRTIANPFGNDVALYIEVD